MGYLLLGMATPWPRGKLTNFTRERWQNKRRRRGKNSILRARRTTLDVYRFRESGWNSPSVNFFTCSRVKGKREKRKDVRRRVILRKNRSLKLMASIIGSRFFFNFSSDRLVIKNGKYIFIEYLYHSFTREQFFIELYTFL